MTPPPAVAIFGIGGFAATHHEIVHSLEQEGVCRLVGTCSPTLTDLEQAVVEQRCLRSRGVLIAQSPEELLERLPAKPDAVLAATPIARHELDHALCVEFDLPLYLEKPPALDPEAFSRMLAREEHARRPTIVGFQALADSRRLKLKERLISGEFGRVERVTFFGFAPRPLAYYQRSTWAGRLMLGGQAVLDSVFGNALAHYLNNLLFWCGEGELWSWGEVRTVEAELYRAHPIEGVDTAFVSGVTTSGIGMRFCGSHACAGNWMHRETIETEAAIIQFPNIGEVEITYPQQPLEIVASDVRDETLEKASIKRFIASLSNRDARSGMTLSAARPFVDFHEAIYRSAGRIHRLEAEDAGEGYKQIPGLEHAFQRFVAGGLWPSELHGFGAGVVHQKPRDDGRSFADAIASLISNSAN